MENLPRTRLRRSRKASYNRLGKAGAKRVILLAFLCLGLIITAILLMNLDSPPGIGTSGDEAPIYKPALPQGSIAPPAAPAEPSETSSSANPALAEPAAPVVTPGASGVTNADLTYLATKQLLIPVAGVTANELRDSFYDERSEGRQHLALDIMAPKDTPVVAVADGSVGKLQSSERGGNMIYQLDSSGRYVYYYGHLSRYADGLSDGKPLKRGEVIGYVGDTGNAGAGNFHLHFGISKPVAPDKWSGGEPINPYPLLRANQ